MGFDLLLIGRSAVAQSTAQATQPSGHLAAGFRYSVYGPEYNPGPHYWRDVGKQMAARFPGSVPGAVDAVGRLKGKGSELSFPGRSEDPLIQFAAEDQNEETLDLFDREGIETWLQVEPGHAPVRGADPSDAASATGTTRPSSAWEWTWSGTVRLTSLMDKR